MLKYLVLASLVCLSLSCQKANQRVVVYCAQDPEFAEEHFAEFPKSSGLSVSPKFDTEANKSVSLAAELLAEKENPRADLHWNNEILNTLRLEAAGVYLPVERSGELAGLPVQAGQGKTITWYAFAARARVLIVNTKRVPEAERPKSIWDMTAAKWKGQVAMAKPQFGTTATQAAVLFDILGADAAMDYYRQLKANDVQLVPGNKQVAKGVSSGQFAFGITDTDDAMVEMLAGQPVAMIFPDAQGHPQHPKLGTILIPNTLAIVKGGPNPEGAKKLMAYLANPSSERRLAQGGAFQIPMHPDLRANDVLPPAMQPVLMTKKADIDWRKAADRWEAVQNFLRDEFAR